MTTTRSPCVTCAAYVDSDKTLAAELPLINTSTPHHKGAPTSKHRISASTEQSTFEPTQTANL